MRAVFVHPAIRNYRAEIFERLSRHGVEFIFTSVSPINTPAHIETARLLRKTNIKYHQCRELSIFGKKNFSFDLWRVFKYDTVIFSCATSIPFLLLSLPLKLMGKRIILFDELWKYPQNIKSYDIIRPYIRFLVKNTVYSFIAAGSRAADYIRDEYDANSQCIQTAFNTTITNFIRPEKLIHSKKFNDLKQHISLMARPVILYLGRLVKYKGLDILIKALSECRVDYTLLIVGDGPFREHCEYLAHTLGITDNVIFWGACDINDATCFYEIADLFVLPTRFLAGEAVGYESWGFTVNEAMAHGVPVVASDAVGAAYDLIIPNQSGFVFPSENIMALKTILSDAIRGIESIKKIGLEGQSFVSQKCSYQQNESAFCKAIGLMQ